METLWKVVGLLLGPICAQLCNGLPINLTTSGPDPHTQYLTGLVAVLLAVCSIVLLAGCVCCRRNKNGFTEFRDSPVVASVASNLDHGHVNPIANSEFTIFTPISPSHQNNNVFLANQRIVNRTEEDVKYGDIDVSSWFDGSEKDFPRTRLKYIRELGKGWFGRVVEGTAQGITQDPGDPEWTPVVVRILEASASSKERVLFLHDADVYRRGYHPNVLMLLGRCLDMSPLLLLQEYCTEGDLKKYLRSVKPTKEKFLCSDLPLLWCYQLTQALKFLHEQKVPHPDLAARNCHLTKDLTLKLGDYGLNSSFYPEDYYQGSLAVPLRWCAPENISYTNTTIQPKKVTLESNIWSLGVTMWEILECGDQPYSELSDDDVVLQVLGSPNIRLPRPTFKVIYTDYMYKLMQSCWSTAESRPSATHVDLILSDLMQVHEHTKVTTEQRTPATIQDFDRRWEALKPNSLITDETPLIQEEKKSESLTNLHGSLDNLLDDQNRMDSWLENVAHSTGDLVYTQGLSEAMMDLDNVLDLSSDSNQPSPRPLHFKIGPKVPTSSESETEDENWKKKIECGAYTEKVRQKSRSVADLMILTHVDYSESDSETLPSLTECKIQKPKHLGKTMENPALKFGSEGNLLSVHDTFQEELRKLQDERRDSLLFVPDKYSYTDSKSAESSSSRQLDSLENSPVKKLIVELNSPSEIIPPKQVYNVFNVSVKHLNNLGVIDNKDPKKSSCDSLKESKDNKEAIHIKNNNFSPEKTVTSRDISCDKMMKDEFRRNDDELKPKSFENLNDFHVKIEVLSDQSSPIDEEIALQEELDRPGSSDDYIKETRKLHVPKLSEIIQRNVSLKSCGEDKLLLTKFTDKDLIDKDSGLNTPENSASLEKLYDDIEEILDEPSVLKKCSKCAISFEENEVYTGSFDSDKSNDLKVDIHKDLCLLKEEIKISSSDGSGCEEDSGTGTSSKETQSIDDNLSAKSLEDTLDTINSDYCLRQSKIICESFLANEKSNYSPTDEYREICFVSNAKSNDISDDFFLKSFGKATNKDVVHQIMSAHLIPDLLTDLPDVDKTYSTNIVKDEKIETLSDYLLKPLIHIENFRVAEPNTNSSLEAELHSNNLNLTKTSLVLPIIKSSNDKESEDSLSSSKSDSIESVAEFLSPEVSQNSDFKTISECSQNNASDALALDNSMPTNTMLDVSSEEMKTLEDGDSTKTLGSDSDCDGNNIEEFAELQVEKNQNFVVEVEENKPIGVLSDDKSSSDSNRNHIEPDKNPQKLSQTKRRDSLDILRKTKEFLCQELVFYDREEVDMKNKDILLQDICRNLVESVENAGKSNDVNTIGLSGIIHIKEILTDKGINVEHLPKKISLEDQKIDKAVLRCSDNFKEPPDLKEIADLSGNYDVLENQKLPLIQQNSSLVQMQSENIVTNNKNIDAQVKSEIQVVNEQKVNENVTKPLTEKKETFESENDPQAFDKISEKPNQSNQDIPITKQVDLSQSEIEQIRLKNNEFGHKMFSKSITEERKSTNSIVDQVESHGEPINEKLDLPNPKIEKRESEEKRSKSPTKIHSRNNQLPLSENSLTSPIKIHKRLGQDNNLMKSDDRTSTTSDVDQVESNNIFIELDFTTKSTSTNEELSLKTPTRDEDENLISIDSDPNLTSKHDLIEPKVVNVEENVAKQSDLGINFNVVTPNLDKDFQQKKNPLLIDKANTDNAVDNVDITLEDSVVAGDSYENILEEHEMKKEIGIESGNTQFQAAHFHVDHINEVNIKNFVEDYKDSKSIGETIIEVNGLESNALEMPLKENNESVERPDKIQSVLQFETSLENTSCTDSTKDEIEGPEGIDPKCFEVKTKEANSLNTIFSNEEGIEQLFGNETRDSPVKINQTSEEVKSVDLEDVLIDFTKDEGIAFNQKLPSIETISNCTFMVAEGENFNETILSKTKDFLNNEIESYMDEPKKEVQVHFDLSDSQEEIAPNSLTHFQEFTSTPFSKKRPLESTVILGASDDYSIDFYSGLKTTVDPVEAENLKFSSNFMQEPSREQNNDLYSLETWDNFLGKSFDEQENDLDFISFNQEPHSLLFLDQDNVEFDNNKQKKTNNLQVSPVVNETYVPDLKKGEETLCKDVTLDKTYDVERLEEQGNATFVKDGSMTVNDIMNIVQGKPTTSTGWESGGGWFLHPQSNPEELSGQIAVQESAVESYVGFSMDDEIMAAIRNELLNKLPHAQRASSEQIEEREELEPAEKNEVFIRYNVYNTPLSPIPEESYAGSDDDSPPYTPKRINIESDDDSSDWSIEDNISSNLYTEVNSPKPESSIISSPAKIPNHRHTPSQDSCCSNDTLFNIEDLNLAIEHDRIFETIPDEDESSKESKYSDCKGEIEETEEKTLIDDRREETEIKREVPKIDVHDYITDFLNNERYNQLNSCVELSDLRSEYEECSSASDKYLTVSDNTLSFGQNVAPLNSPEDRQWKDLQASFRTCEETERDQTMQLNKTYLTPIENADYVEDLEKVGRNFELVTDLDDPDLDNLEECRISDEDIDKVLQEEDDELIGDNKEGSHGKVEDNISPNLDKELISSARKEDNRLYVNTSSDPQGCSAMIQRSNLDDAEYDGVTKYEDSPEYVYVEKHEDNHEYENGWIADTIYANMPVDRAKELDYVIAEENKKAREENIEDLYGPLADIRFSGPGLGSIQMMSTSFSESNEVGEEQDWDSGSDTRSSSSGEFIWREGEHEASVKALDAAPQSENAQEMAPMEDIQEEKESSSSDSDGEGECPEFVPSAWDKYAIPAKSALRSPEKTLERKDPKDKKAVWFKKQKYHCIYEYPKEPDSPILQSYDLWKPTPDYATLADWELGPDMYVPSFDLIDPLTSMTDQQRSSKNLYHLTAFPEQGPTVLDEEFYVSSSSKPFDMLGGLTSQFFPGRQFSDHWIDAATPDSGDEVVPMRENNRIPTLKHLATIAANRNRKSPRELGGLRHTRSKLKLDLPPSPSAFSGNTTFTVEQPAEEIVPRQVPTFSTFGKSRFQVQHVDTPPDDKSSNKNVSFEALPYKPQAPTPSVKERHAIESVRGEASLLDSTDEDSGIDSSTLERGKKVGT